MSSNPGLTVESQPAFKPGSTFSPLRVAIFLIVTIYVTEIVAMAIFYFIPVHNYLIATVLDGVIMVVLILPALYWLQM